jgi:hypothetical protein
MRKKMLLLALALAASAASLTTSRAIAGETTYFCPICTTYEDGSQCCVSCTCNSAGVPIACTDHFCPPADGGGA